MGPKLKNRCLAMKSVTEQCGAAGKSHQRGCCTNRGHQLQVERFVKKDVLDLYCTSMEDAESNPVAEAELCNNRLVLLNIIKTKMTAESAGKSKTMNEVSEVFLQVLC